MCSVVWYVTLVNKMFAMKIWQRCGNSSKLFYCRWLMSQNGDQKTSHLTHKYRFSYKNNNMKYFGCYNSYLSHIQQSGFNRYFFTWVYDEFVICLWIGPPHVVPFFRETPIFISYIIPLTDRFNNYYYFYIHTCILYTLFFPGGLCDSNQVWS